jgi:ParB family chromosome partitioning protein
MKIQYPMTSGFPGGQGVEMKKAISEIVVEEGARIRKDVGDIAALEKSIANVGLLNPVVIDENNRLVAGYRRLAACRRF